MSYVISDRQMQPLQAYVLTSMILGSRCCVEYLVPNWVVWNTATDYSLCVLYCGVMPSNAVLVPWYAKYTTLVNNSSSARITVSSIAPFYWRPRPTIAHFLKLKLGGDDRVAFKLDFHVFSVIVFFFATLQQRNVSYLSFPGFSVGLGEVQVIEHFITPQFIF